MAQLAITWQPQGTSGVCGLCTREVACGDGPGLCLAESGNPVCRACGKARTPALVALLDLAGIADHVGRIGRHTLVPPMGALLELAGAAENYTRSHARPLRGVRVGVSRAG